jgi:hypothetical protein
MVQPLPGWRQGDDRGGFDPEELDKSIEEAKKKIQEERKARGEKKSKPKIRRRFQADQPSLPCTTHSRRASQVLSSDEKTMSPPIRETPRVSWYSWGSFVSLETSLYFTEGTEN